MFSVEKVLCTHSSFFRREVGLGDGHEGTTAHRRNSALGGKGTVHAQFVFRREVGLR